jgi:hypothetical protein
MLLANCPFPVDAVADKFVASFNNHFLPSLEIGLQVVFPSMEPKMLPAVLRFTFGAAELPEPRRYSCRLDVIGEVQRDVIEVERHGRNRCGLQHSELGVPRVRGKNGRPRQRIQMPGRVPDGLASSLGAWAAKRIRRYSQGAIGLNRLAN